MTEFPCYTEQTCGECCRRLYWSDRIKVSIARKMDVIEDVERELMKVLKAKVDRIVKMITGVFVFALWMTVWASAVKYLLS